MKHNNAYCIIFNEFGYSRRRRVWVSLENKLDIDNDYDIISRDTGGGGG